MCAQRGSIQSGGQLQLSYPPNLFGSGEITIRATDPGGLATQLNKSGVDEASATKREGDLGHLGRVLTSGLAAYRMTTTAGTSTDLTVESVARALERQAAREVDNLKRGLNLLATVGSTAPFVGLLGTVVGIMHAFRQMAHTGQGGFTVVAAGISEALVTTAGGIAVAVEAVIIYNFLNTHVQKLALEFKLLVTLFDRRNRVQTRAALLSDVWGIDADITTRTVDTHVKRLREKLGTAGEYIETVRGVGYRFTDTPGEATD